MVQNDHYFGSDTELGFFLRRKNDIFLGWFSVVFFLVLGILFGFIWYAFWNILDFFCSTSIFNGF